MARKPSNKLLWVQYFRDPSQWWDYRKCKTSPTHPDFKHKVTKESLWIDNWSNPCWVGGELHKRGQAQVHDEEVDEVTALVALLRACTKNKDLCRGIRAHDVILRKGLLEQCSDGLITMYAKCGALEKAKELFDIYRSRDLLTWTALIAGYAQNGLGQNALNCYAQMRDEGLSPDAVTYSCVLKACSSIKAGDKGEEVHDEIAKQGLLNNLLLGTGLVNMYAKCGALEKARLVLEELPLRNVVSWNALITGYVEHGKSEQALSCLEPMQREGISPDTVTFVCILKACGGIGAVDKGEQIHIQIAKQGVVLNDIVLGTALVDMYAKCGVLSKAGRVLEELPKRDVIAWTALISGYAEHGEGERALDCYEQMLQEGQCPNAATFVCILNACGSIKATEKGGEIHEEIVKMGWLQNNVVLGNALVDMYAKCGALSKAREVLEDLPGRDVISWTALITGYTENGEGEQALDCLQRMQQEGLSPNAVTFICILKACGNTGAADKGEKIHDQIAKQGLFGSEIAIGNALVDMYAKCGALARAQKVLEELPVRNVISWTAIIAGYVQWCECAQALQCFEQMQRDGLSPDVATISCVLSACSRLGLVEDAQKYFMMISTEFGMEPDFEHHTCMVDLFGRAGHLDQAIGVLERLPKWTVVVWSVLLVACQKWGDVDVGRWAFDHAVQEDKTDATVYVLMANTYAAAGMQKDAEVIEAMRVKNKAWHKPAQSLWFDTNSNSIHLNFVGDDTSQAQSNLIEMKL